MGRLVRLSRRERQYRAVAANSDGPIWAPTTRCSRAAAAGSQWPKVDGDFSSYWWWESEPSYRVIYVAHPIGLGIVTAAANGLYFENGPPLPPPPSRRPSATAAADGEPKSELPIDHNGRL